MALVWCHCGTGVSVALVCLQPLNIEAVDVCSASGTADADDLLLLQPIGGRSYFAFISERGCLLKCCDLIHVDFPIVGLVR